MNAAGLFRFSRAELVFSLKCFVAAMLAMYIASRLGLPRPFWALMTTYVVANPLAGAVRSKALFRLLGTTVGCTAALVLVPALSNAPELLTLALASWSGVCLFFSLQDRTPRSYVFMLAGYTAALIGFPAVSAPQTLFDTAVARVGEIGLGIVVATAVHSLVLPTGMGATVLGLLDRGLRDARQWLLDLMQPAQREPGAALGADRARVATDITQLRLLSTHIPFDTTHLRWTAGAVRAVQDRVASLTPALSAVEDRLQALQQAEGELAPDVSAVLARVAQWLQALDAPGGTADAARHEADALALHQAIREFGAASEGQPSWPRALRLSLAAGLDELVDGWRACVALRREVDEGLRGVAPPSRRVRIVGNRVLHRDVGMALLSSLAAVVAICLCSAFWILTGWPSGSAAVMMAAVFCSFFATLDDPVLGIHAFLKYTLWSVPLAALYLLVLLPTVHDFGMLVAVCAPLFLLLGCFVARPTTMGIAMPIVFGVAGALALHDTANADLVTFTNSMIAQVFGMVVAGRTTKLIRSVGVDWSARRIQRANWRELADMAATPRRQVKVDAYAVRMLDRISLLAPRMAAAGGAIDGVSADAMRDLRLGVDVVAMQRARGDLPPGLGARLMHELEHLFRERTASKASANPASLLKRIDEALQAALDVPGDASRKGRSAISALVGLRRNLYPDAPPVRAVAVLAEGAAS